MHWTFLIYLRGSDFNQGTYVCNITDALAGGAPPSLCMSWINLARAHMARVWDEHVSRVHVVGCAAVVSDVKYDE